MLVDRVAELAVRIVLSRWASVIPFVDGIFATPRRSEYRMRRPDESNVMVACVCAAVRLGNDALTIVAPEPPVRITLHSPPESTGAISGTNARIAASPVRGLNDSPMKTSVRWAGVVVRTAGVEDGVEAVADVGVGAGSGARGAGLLHAREIAPATNTVVVVANETLMVFSTFGPGDSIHGIRSRGPVLPQ
jgi:hypothetical protein